MQPRSVSDVVEVHLEAFDGYMNALLGRGYVFGFLSWFCDASDGIALTARLGGQVVGYVVGAPVGYNARLTRDLAWVVARSMACRPWLVLRRDIRGALRARLGSLIGEDHDRTSATDQEGTPSAAVSLVGIGVAGAARGRGVGGALMGAFECAAMGCGLQRMRLTVYRGNIAACKVYERAGWVRSEINHGPTVSYEKQIVTPRGRS